MTTKSSSVFGSSLTGPEVLVKGGYPNITHPVWRSPRIFHERASEEDEFAIHETMTEEPRGAQAGGSRVTILVVADDPLMQRVLKRAFRDQDYAVTICGGAPAGLGAFRTEQPEAVILDLMLPNITGRELCKMMKSEQPETPVIVVSAISEVDNKVLLMKIGADDYVIKPFSPRELIVRVERALKRPRTR